MMKHLILAATLAAELSAAASTFLNLACDRKDAVCKVGDEVTFTLTATDEAGAPVRTGTLNVSVDNFGTKSVVAKRTYDFAEANPIVIRGKMDEPGFMRINVVMPNVTNFLWSVAVSPELIRSGAPCPDDFDAFWEAEIATYDATVKEDVELTPVPQLATEALDFFKVTLSAPHGRKIYGMLSRPKDLTKGPYPLRFEGKGAGPASQGRSGKAGRVTLEMNVHYYDAPVPSTKAENGKLQDEESYAWQARYPTKKTGYQFAGIAAGRDEYFYHDVILATRRVFRWAAKLPYVDPADVTYLSTSQGGGFGLYMAALCPQIRKLAVYVPALTDLCGFRVRRMSGWPRLVEAQLDENRAAATANAGYYDAVNFAARVRCPTRVTVGFSDDTCPPPAVYSAYNALRVKDKDIWHGVGMTHLVRGDLYVKGERWLAVKESPTAGGGTVKTPETSCLFARKEDPKTGVVSYWLKPGLVDFHQQSLYFTAKSMTDDGRFLVFDASPDPLAAKGVRLDTETRRKYVVDFLRDEVYPVGGPSVDGQIPFLDTKTDKLYYVGKDHLSVCVCDLANDPQGETVLCRFSDEILEGGAAVARMGTHLTLTPDRTQAFLDYSVYKDASKRDRRLGSNDLRWFLGLADLRTGKMRKWAETDFCSNHASIHPTDPTLGLFAYEGCWNKTVTGPDGVRKSVPRGEDEIYPRLWLAHADGRTEMIPSRIWNFGTHENWTEDGKGFYWSAYHGGTAYHDLATGEQTRVCPFWCIHTDMSPDGKYVVTDQWADGDGFRGCAWRYAFWNRTTGRGVAIRSYSPAITTKERQSPLHPDAHVQFVCGGKYIVATANGDDGRMNVAVTPVAPLAALTSSAVTAPRPHRLPIFWEKAADKDVLCEIVADCAAFQRQGLVTPPPVRCDVAWVPYGVFAVVDGARRRLAVKPYLGEKPMETVVRFVVPKGTTSLDFVVNAPGRFEPQDRDTLAKQPAARRLTLGAERMPAAWDGDWPKGTDPKTVSRRLSELFLTTAPDDYHPAGYALSDGRPQKGYGWRQCIFYATVSLWINALECARLTGDAALERRLVAAFEPFLGPKIGHFPKFRHVDYTIAGAVPLEVAILTGDARAKALGLKYADMQWAEPKPDDPPPPMNQTPFEERLKLWKDGYSDQTRLWIDDAYMMTVLQSQAYRLTKDPKYIVRAAKEMCLYLDKLQLADGLFNHAPEAPHKWGRGNGWMAAGMPMVLKHLPETSPYRAKILAGYRKMMATLLAAQNEDGMWNQLVGDRESWEETSATAMFTFAFAMGARHGWLDAATYGPAARKGYLALVDRLDCFGNVPDVCAGTCTKDDRAHYLNRPRINGDPHGQAPLLWICAALLEEGDLQANIVPVANQVKGDFFTIGETGGSSGTRVLFMGNSITLHNPKPSIGWTNRCGMAASAAERDYVHLVMAEVLKRDPQARFAIAQVSGTIEHSFTNADWSAAARFQEARAFRPDVIVAFFGANVPRDYDDAPATFPRRFGTAVGEALDYVDPERKAAVLLSEGYYIRPVLDEEKKQLARRRKAKWVEIDDIRRRADTHGLHNHPNDLGMKLIAERFAKALVRKQ